MNGPLTWRFGDDVAPLRRAVRQGRLVAIPTESSYGLAVDPRNAEAVQRIFTLKGRRAGEPLPVVVGDRGQIEAFGGSLSDPLLQRLATAWPAALSLLVPLSGELPAAAGSPRLAVRIPDHAQLRRLLQDLGTGLTATSANESGRPALVDPEEVRRLLSASPGSVLIDDGVLPGGQPSTLVGVREGEVELLRTGRVGSGEIVGLLGPDRGDWSFSAASVEILADES